MRAALVVSFGISSACSFFDSGGGGIIADAQSGSGSLDINDGVLLQKIKYSPHILKQYT